MNLKTRLTIYFLLLVGVVAGLSLAGNYFSANRLAIQDTTRTINLYARLVSNQIDYYLAEKQTQTNRLSQHSLMRRCVDGNAPCPVDELNTELLQIDGYIGSQVAEVIIMDNVGSILYSTYPANIGREARGTSFFLQGVTEPTVIGIEYSSEHQSEVLEVTSPIIVDSEIRGSLTVRYYLDNLFHIFAANPQLDAEYKAYLVNEDLALISPLEELNDQILDVTISNEASQQCKALIDRGSENWKYQENQLVEYTSYSGSPAAGSYQRTLAMPWCTIVEIPAENLQIDPTHMSQAILLSIALVLLSAMIMDLIVHRQVSLPLESFNRALREIASGNDRYKVDITSPKELSAASKLLQRLSQSVTKAKARAELKAQEQTSEITKQNERLAEQRKAILNVLEDVEEQKELLEAVAKDQEKFKLAVDNVSDHIVITDPEGIVLYANDAVERITGYSNTEVIGKKAGAKELWGGLMGKEFYKKLWHTIKELKQPFSGEITNRRKTGEKYEAFASISPVLDDQGEVLFFVGIERDISEEKKIDKAKNEFVSLASHQLRTPLTSINWYSEMLVENSKSKYDEETTDYLNEIHAASKRMANLVDALLNISRIELGTFSINPQSVNITEIARTAIDELQPLIKEKRQNFQQDFQKDLPEVEVDPDLTFIILQNLLTNAVKYTDSDGSIGCTIKIEDGKLVIQVSDTGHGIPTSQQDRIFEKLFRADNVKTLDTEGTGLGLYMIKEILDSAGGEITFTSEEGKGTTFTVTLPVSGMKAKRGSKTLNVKSEDLELTKQKSKRENENRHDQKEDNK